MTLTELNAYFQSKGKENLPTLGHADVPVAFDYPRPWANPRILSQTAAYQIVRNSKLPDELEAAYRQVSLEDIALYANSFEKYVSILSKGSIRIYSYLSRIENIQLKTSVDTHFFYLLNKTKGIGISRTGSIRYWENINLDQPICHNISLFNNSERITAVKKMGVNRLVLGSSTGEIYILTIYPGRISVSTIYMHTGILSFMSGLVRTPLPCRSETEKPYDAQPILNLKLFENTLYSVDKNYVSLWCMKQGDHTKLVARIDLGSKITSSIFRHIPSDIPKTEIKTEIVNSCIAREAEIIVLASYSIPDLGEYVQYALITFRLDISSSTARAIHTTSIPYTAIPATLKSKPRVSVTCALAFIKFDDTLIAVSLDKVCTFEESVVFKKDYVLYIEVYHDAKKDTDNAVIYTMNSGIIELQVNIAKIHLPNSVGNMYFSVVNDPEKRKAEIFSSKFNEAAIYGAPDQSPLVFPLRSEQAYIGPAAMNMSKDILRTVSTVLPSRNYTDLYIESRYVFEKRIMTVLSENNWMSQISLDDRRILMLRAETYCISLALWEFYKEKSGDFSSQKYWNEILSKFVSRNNISIKELSVDHVFVTVDVIGKICSSLLSDVEDDQLKLLDIFKNTNELLLRMLAKADWFEENYTSVYGVDLSKVVYPISVQLCCMALPLFKLNVKFITDVKNDTENMMSDSLDVLQEGLSRFASLSLMIASKELLTSEVDDEEAKLEYKKVRKSVIEGLCKSGLYEIAIDLAQKYNDIPALIVTIQTSDLSPQDIHQRNIQYIEQFGEVYFSSLLKHLNQNGDGKENNSCMMELLTAYPHYAQQFHENDELKVSWIYYLLQKNYRKSLTSLELSIVNETNQDQLIRYQSWRQILLAALKQ